jgi:hypothetical protein
MSKILGPDGSPVKKGTIKGAYGEDSEAPGRKLNLYVRYWPDNGAFKIQVYDGGSLAPVIYSGQKTRDVPRLVGRSRMELLQISKKIMEAVLYGINNDPMNTGVVMPTPPAIVDEMKKAGSKGQGGE